MIFNIEVTQEDIDKGEKESADSCAISLAFRRVDNVDPMSVVVGEDDGFAMFQTNDKKWWKALLPTFAHEFYKDFDKGLEVHPIKFTVDADLFDDGYEYFEQ